MRKFLLFILLFFICSTAFGHIIMSSDLINSSLQLSQEKWTDKCVKERLPNACRTIGCSAREAGVVEYEIRKSCWKQYNGARKSAYMRKNMLKR